MSPLERREPRRGGGVVPPMEPVSGQVSALAVSRRPRLGGGGVSPPLGDKPCVAVGRPPRDAAVPAESSGAGFGCAPGRWKLPGLAGEGQGCPPASPARGEPPVGRSTGTAGAAAVAGPGAAEPAAEPARQQRRHKGARGASPRGHGPVRCPRPGGPGWEQRPPPGTPGSGLGSGVASEGLPETRFCCRFVVMVFLQSHSVAARGLGGRGG